MIDYLRGIEADLQIYTYVGGVYRPFFSDIEIRHMIDVQRMSEIAFFMRNLFIGLFIAGFVPFVVFRNKLYKHNIWIYLFKSWKYVSAGIFAALAILVGIIAINWMEAWVIFHRIFFDNDYWILNPSMDLLVNIVPYPFFITISIFVGGFFAAGLVLVFILGLLLARRVRKFALYG
jgi:integral membrane protein (TIGR01906 family)